MNMQKLGNQISIALFKTLYVVFFITTLATFSSCTTTKNLTYFKTLNKDTTLALFVSDELETKIQKNDIIGITVSSLSNEMDEKFNTNSKLSADNNMLNSTNYGYLINENGEVNLHFIGMHKVVGLTRKQLSKNLEKELLPYMKEPIVSVQYLNRKVTVLGEVVTPKIIYMSEGKMPLIDVIVSCGDMKENAIAQDIMIIRDSSNQKIIKHINLEDNSIFSSDWYYSKPDDIVYIKKNSAQIDKEERKRTFQTTISLVASMSSLLVIILNILLK